MTTIPVIPSLDLQRSAEFYKTYFDCQADWYDEYVVLHNTDHFSIHIWKSNDPYLCINSGFYLRVKNVDAMFERLNIPGVIHPNGQLETKPWGMKEFAITDPDGNLVRIGEYQVKNATA
ncbi:MAG: VOC family protein [Chitinophagaceae bacterium]